MAPVIRFDRLTCGMPVCIETTNESKLLSISVWINAGSVSDPAGKSGLAHFCEHLLLRPLAFTDTRAYCIQHKAGALVNAYTDAEWVVISAQVPAEQTRALIELLSILLSDPYCETDGVKLEKEAILNEIRDNNPGFPERLASIFRESAFTHNPQALPGCGTAATLEAIETGDVQGYYSRFLTGSTTMITVHGNTSAEELTALLDKAFGAFSNVSHISGSTTGESDNGAQSIPAYHPVTIRQNKSYTGSNSRCGVLAGFGSVTRMSEEYWTALVFEVLMADGPGSLLFQWLRKQHNWSYGAVSMTEAFSNWGCQYFLMTILSDRVEEALDYLGRQWRALPEQLTDERVEALGKRFACRALSSLSDPQDRMTLLRDILLSESMHVGTMEGSIETIVDSHVRELSTGKLLSYVRHYAEWDRVSLVCIPIP